MRSPSHGAVILANQLLLEFPRSFKSLQHHVTIGIRCFLSWSSAIIWNEVKTNGNVSPRTFSLVSGPNIFGEAFCSGLKVLLLSFFSLKSRDSNSSENCFFFSYEVFIWWEKKTFPGVVLKIVFFLPTFRGASTVNYCLPTFRTPSLYSQQSKQDLLGKRGFWVG